MGQIERLIQNFDRFVSLPWERNLAGAQKVWFAVYNKAEERRLRARFGEFELSAQRAKHRWLPFDLTDTFASWLGQEEPDYRDSYFEMPELLTGEATALREFRETVTRQVSSVLSQPDADETAVVALQGVASLFGFMRVSELLQKVESKIRGRLLVFFPGEYEGKTYRFLDAREGWNYLAVPITSEESMLKP